MMYLLRVATVTLRALNGVSQLVLMCASTPEAVRNCSSAMSSRSATALDELRLHLDDLGIGEPADQVDVVHGEIDHHADIRHARRERADAGDGDRQDILVADRLLDRLDRRIEPLDVADHQRDAGAPRGRDDGASLLDRRGDRLLDQHVHAALDAGEREIPMQMGGRSDGHGIDAGGQQRLDVGIGLAAERAGHEVALLAVGIGDADELDARKIGEARGHGCCP